MLFFCVVLSCGIMMDYVGFQNWELQYNEYHELASVG